MVDLLDAEASRSCDVARLRLMGFICAAGILAIAAYVVIYVLSRG